jgi:hypothetical protein
MPAALGRRANDRPLTSISNLVDESLKIETWKNRILEVLENESFEINLFS